MDVKNSVISYNGIEIYKSDIDILCAEYAESLYDPTMVTKSAGFTGLLQYIYKHGLSELLKRDKGKPYNYDVLDKVFFNVYIPLCSKYGMTPTIIQFSSLVHVDNTAISDVKTGIRQNATNTEKQTVKNWYDVCESALLSRAVDFNSIGGIFALKSCYGYRDNVVVQEISQAPTVESPEQIAARHKQAALNMPEKPDL